MCVRLRVLPVLVDELAKPAVLYDNGTLTDAEFAAG